MKRPRSPMFLAPDHYRKRRLRDAARLLPILGLLLVLVPILWAADGEERLTSGDAAYFFVVWLFLILVAGAFARGLRKGERPEEED